jgi:hypothetical protein
VSSVADLAGVWEARSPEHVVARLSIDPAGRFEVTSFPISALGPVPRSADWSRTADFEGSWNHSDDTLTLDFDPSDVSGGYVGPAYVSSTFGHLYLSFLVSADQNLFIKFEKLP